MNKNVLRTVSKQLIRFETIFHQSTKHSSRFLLGYVKVTTAECLVFRQEGQGSKPLSTNLK